MSTDQSLGNAQSLEKRESGRIYADPNVEHVSLGGPIRNILFWILTAPLLFFSLGGPTLDTSKLESKIPWFVSAVIGSFLWSKVVSGVRVAAEWEQGVILTLGKFSEVRGSGVFYVLPFVENVRFVDTRVQVVNIPKQRAITRDNVPIVIDSALFLVVKNPGLAVTKVQNYKFATSQYVQSALRDVVGSLTLDELLSEREKVQEQIAAIVGEKVRNWGLGIDSVQLQDFDLPEELKKVMSRQASAEREKRATMTKAEGDRLAAQNLAQAAELMEKNPMALELRTLQTIDGLAGSPSNTVVLFPMELMNAMKFLSHTSEDEKEKLES